MEHFLYSGGIILLVATAIILLRRLQLRLKLIEIERDEIDAEEHRMFSFLHGLGGALQEDSSPPSMHKYIVEGVTEVVAAEGGVLYLTDPDIPGQLLPVFLTDEGAPPLLELTKRVLHDPAKRLRSHIRSHPLRRGQGFIGEALAKQTTLVTWDLMEHPSMVEKEKNEIQSGLRAMAAPLIYGDKEVGVLAVSRHGSAFSDNDRDVFASVAEQSSVALGSAIIHAEAHEKRRYEDELQRAGEIQRILLPKNPPDLADYHVAAEYQPARMVSGDYYDYVQVDKDRYGVVIGDVCGKGVAASLIMAMVRSLLRSNARGAILPTTVLHAVNRALYPDIREDMFVSLLYVILDRNSDRILAARAGHEPLLVYRAATQEIESFEPPGLAAGIDDGPVFERVLEEFRFSLQEKDILLLYTDGAIEAENPKGEEYGHDRLVETLKANSPFGSEAVVKAISDEVTNFSDGAVQSDDITLIAIEKH